MAPPSPGRRERGSDDRLLDVFGPQSWCRPEQVAVDRLPMRTTCYPFPDDAVAATVDRSASPWFHLLDGDDWDFRLLARPEAVTAEIFDDGDDGWQPIAVPGCWTMDPDVDDSPQYTNLRMPFPQDPPHVPDHNPTGVYRRRFSLQRGWKSRRTVLHVGGAESCLYVFCNGEAVGMGKDSRLPQEFDLTPHLRTGANTLVLVVVRWSDGSWLEDQDHWWNAGLHREVFLYSTGRTHIADLRVDGRARRGPRHRPVQRRGGGRRRPGRCAHRCGVAGGGHADRSRRRRREHPAPRAPKSPGSTGRRRWPRRSAPTCTTAPSPRVAETIDAVTPWSSERPVRYTVVVSLIDPGGDVVEATATRIGFRRVEIVDRELLLNGYPVFIRGVNRHDHDPDTGKTVSVESMRHDVVAHEAPQHQRGANLALPERPPVPRPVRRATGCGSSTRRTSRPTPAWRSLSDDPRFGAGHPRPDPADGGAATGTTRRCSRSRSATSRATAPVHDAAAAWIRRTDPSRVVHYEGACMAAFFGTEEPGDPGTCHRPGVPDVPVGRGHHQLGGAHRRDR